MARESKPFRDRNPVIIGAVSLTVIAALVFLAFNAQSLPLIGGGTVYQAQFSEAAGLQPDDPVRVAGVKVGKVESLALEHGAVTVEFRVSDAFVGDQSEAAIKIETVLGAKYLALVPRGSTELDPDKPIPVDRTASPYDVVEAFADLSTTVEQIDTTQLAELLRGAVADLRRHPGRGAHVAAGAGPALGHDLLARRPARPAAVGHPAGQPGAGRPQRGVHPADRRLQHPAHRGAASAGS